MFQLSKFPFYSEVATTTKQFLVSSSITEEFLEQVMPAPSLQRMDSEWLYRDEVIVLSWNTFKTMHENPCKMMYIMLKLSKLNVKGSGHIPCRLIPPLLKSRGKGP